MVKNFNFYLFKVKKDFPSMSYYFNGKKQIAVYS